MEQTKSQPKVSILIPVYNTACYLPKCLASVMDQTLKEIEIIVVNDASPDNAAEILADYAARDPRIKVITHEKNGGILAARLSGIAAAAGEYMMVLDADDYLDLDTARACYAKAKKTGADMIHFCFDVRIGHKKKNHFARRVEKRINPYNGKLLGKEVFEGAFVKYLYSWNICGKFIAAEVCRKAAASLPPGYYIMAEDFCFYTMLSWYATHYEPLFKKCYYYGLDIGVSNYGLTDYPGFIRNCTVFAALKAVKSFLQKQGCFEKYSKEFMEQERRLLDDLLERWEKKLTRYDRVRALSYMFENYDPQGLMRSFISYFAGRENVLGSLMGMPEYFRRRKTAVEVRHIGLYLRDKTDEDAIARLLKKCAADWQKAGYEITVIAASCSYDCLSLPAGMERIPMPGRSAVSDRETLQQRSAFWFGLREKYGIDTIVHGDSDCPKMIFDALSIKLAGMNLIGVPLTGLHALADSSMGGFLAKMRAMLLADGLAVLTVADKVFYSSFGQRCCKISMAGTEMPEENPPEGSRQTGMVNSISISPSKPRLLWLGHFGDPEAETVLLAWAKLSREFPKYRLCMLGRSRNGVSDRCVLTLADSMNLAQTLEVYSDPDEFISLLPESKLFFMTSAKSDCSIYAETAKQAGKPVFLSQTPSPEILAEKLSGILKGLEKGSEVPEQQDCSGLELFRDMISGSAPGPFPAEELLETLAGYQQKFEPYELLPANRGPSFIQIYRKLDELMYRILPPVSGRRDWFFRFGRFVLNRFSKKKGG
jgi:glycosyltransferase involved in cell wall biosynthesis